MAARRRYLEGQVRKDLARKMVFISGPRQVGKTTLALGLGPKGYLSWDVPADRERIPWAGLAVRGLGGPEPWTEVVAPASDGRR